MRIFRAWYWFADGRWGIIYNIPFWMKDGEEYDEKAGQRVL